jgi:hypothetical protein
MSAPTASATALVTKLLALNFKDSLPIVIMIFMIQGIHPEIIFELVSYVTLTHQQYCAILDAIGKLRMYTSILPAIKGRKYRSYQDQLRMFQQNPQHRVSILFENFKQVVLSSTLKKCGFVGNLPPLQELSHFVSILANVRVEHLNMFSIEQIFLSPNVDLILMRTALEMQRIIILVRSSYPEIVSFLAQNDNALRNLILVWKKQVNACELIYDRQSHLPEPKKITIIFAFCILAVIDPSFVDEHLAEFIKSCGNSHVPLHFSQKYHDFMIEQDPEFECHIDSNHGSCSTIRRICRLFYSRKSSDVPGRMIEYSMTYWTLGFGHIRASSQFEFESPTTLLRSQTPIFEVFLTFWDSFFRNFARTFAVSFLPIGNIPWSERYTCLCTTEFDWIIRIAVENFALKIGAKDNHAFLKSKISWLSNCEITTASYGRLIFPDGMRNCKMSSEICSFFLRDFWHTHQKPNPTMNDIEYIRWLFSIPEYASFGDSWIKLMDALQNGTELPRVQDGSSGDFGYLSCPTVPTDQEVEKNYDENFRQQLGRDPEIGDYAEGTAVPP